MPQPPAPKIVAAPVQLAVLPHKGENIFIIAAPVLPANPVPVPLQVYDSRTTAFRKQQNLPRGIEPKYQRLTVCTTRACTSVWPRQNRDHWPLWLQELLYSLQNVQRYRKDQWLAEVQAKISAKSAP